MLFLEMPREKDPGEPAGPILLEQAPHGFDLRDNRGAGGGRQENGSVLLSLPVMKRQQHGIQVETLGPQFQTFRQPQAAPVKQRRHQAIARFDMGQQGFDFRA